MIRLNRLWWQHLAPKSMHRRLGEIERLLTNWCTTSYGQLWLKVACNPSGVLRLLPGQPIPVVHFIALGHQDIYIAAQRCIREGHRSVGGTEFISGHTLSANEHPISPMIRLDVVTDQALIDTALQRQIPRQVPGVTLPSIVFTIPAHHLLSPQRWPDRAYALYQHIFGEGNSYPDDGFFYVGITKRRWQSRWAEHMRAVEKGSQLLFHKKFREERGAARITYIHHKVMAITDDLEALYSAEKFLIESHWDDERRLNMIPGGKAGLRYLREQAILSKGELAMPDDREQVLGDWLDRHSRQTLPRMTLADKWQDDAWAAAQICSRSDRLSLQQIAAIRDLSAAHEPEEISGRTGATIQQIQDILLGKTYARVK